MPRVGEDVVGVGLRSGALAASMMIGALIRGDVLGGDHAAERRGDQHVDVELQQLLVGDLLGVRIAVAASWSF